MCLLRVDDSVAVKGHSWHATLRPWCWTLMWLLNRSILGAMYGHFKHSNFSIMPPFSRNKFWNKWAAKYAKYAKPVKAVNAWFRRTFGNVLSSLGNGDWFPPWHTCAWGYNSGIRGFPPQELKGILRQFNIWESGQLQVQADIQDTLIDWNNVPLTKDLLQGQQVVALMYRWKVPSFFSCPGH